MGECYNFCSTSFLKRLVMMNCFVTLISLTMALSQLLDNYAERAIRPLTTQRNSMLHFGSDEGAEMTATYHSIISTVKMQGRSAWEYLGKFFTKIFNGCRDFFSLRPDKIWIGTMPIVNKKVKFLTTQYIGTCKSAYTKGYALN